MVSSISGYIVDALNRTVHGAVVKMRGDGVIDKISYCKDPDNVFIVPGFIDSHVHIESSMLTPSAFASAAVVHGVIGAVCDPHEITNVLGTDGVKLMLESASQTSFVFGFGAPSCVPSCRFDFSGACVGAKEIFELLRLPGITHLGEVMCVGEVLDDDPNIHMKIRMALLNGKPADGHAPGLTGLSLEKYLFSGVSSDHESLTVREALDKIRRGMMIHIRSGSAAPEFESFIPLLKQYYDLCMFCSDDKHPDDLVRSYINGMAAEAYRQGVSVYSIVKAACINPVLRYKLPLGLLRQGDTADFLIIRDLPSFKPEKVFLRGNLVAENGHSLITSGYVEERNVLNARPVTEEMLQVKACGAHHVNVIWPVKNSLVTKRLTMSVTDVNGTIEADREANVQKIAVIDRYSPEIPPMVGFVKGFGRMSGAIASSISHDSHNIVVVGSDDCAMCEAVNCVIASKGGLAVADLHGRITSMLRLPIGGLMTNGDAETVASDYKRCKAAAMDIGVDLVAPFMTLSFMTLPVIPEIRITSRGLFDVKSSSYLPVVE